MEINLYPTVFYDGYELFLFGRWKDDDSFRIMARGILPPGIPQTDDAYGGYCTGRLPVDRSGVIPPPDGFIFNPPRKTFTQAFEDNIRPEIASIDEFHILRCMRSETILEEKRHKLKWLRDCMPGRGRGQLLRKFVGVKTAQKFLDGTYDPVICGCGFFRGAMIGYYGGRCGFGDLSQGEEPAVLRGDYSQSDVPTPLPEDIHDLFWPPCKVSPQRKLYFLEFPKTDDFNLVPAYGTNMAPPPVGVMTDPDPNWPGNGFTATKYPVAIPEFAFAPKENGCSPFVQLPDKGTIRILGISRHAELGGSYDETGVTMIDGKLDFRTFAELDNREVWPKGHKPQPPRPQIRKMAEYHGHRLFVCSACDTFYHVAAFGEPLPSKLLVDMDLIGRVEYRGKIPKSDTNLKWLE